MPRQNTAQLNVRSAFARARAMEIAKQTGMTTTEVVEDALRGYVPPGQAARVGTMVRQGPILVRVIKGKRRVTFEEAEAALEAVRNRDL